MNEKIAIFTFEDLQKVCRRRWTYRDEDGKVHYQCTDVKVYTECHEDNCLYAHKVLSESWEGVFLAWMSGGADVYSCNPDGSYDDDLMSFLVDLEGKRGKLTITFEEE